jgi:hypothetical protein
MATEQELHIRELVNELKASTNVLQQNQSPAAAKEAFAGLLARSKTIAAAVEEAGADDDTRDGLSHHLADGQMLLDHWDELTPVWEARERMGKLLGSLPRAPESIPSLVTAARELQEALRLKRELMPAGYVQPQLDELNQLLARISPPPAG